MLEINPHDLAVLFLVFGRIVAIIALFPIFGHNNVPAMAKVGLSLLLSLILYPMVKTATFEVPVEVFPLIFLFTKEVFVGMAIGFTAVLLFAGVELGGTLIGMQMGFGIARVIDPQTRQQTSIIGQVQQLLALLVFLVIDGHHFLIRALTFSFEAIPVLGSRLTSTMATKLLAMGGDIFEIAVKIGAPVIVALLLTSVAMGILARTVPQMNIFIVSFPLKIGVGMLVLGMSLPIFLMVFRKLFAQFQTDFLALIRLM